MSDAEIPDITDIDGMLDLVHALGKEVRRNGHEIANIGVDMQNFSITLSLFDPRYRSCKHCDQEIYNDAGVWVDAVEESMDCSAEGYEKHSPREKV